MRRLIAEYEEQSFTQIIFPHFRTDWHEYLDEAEANFINIIDTIIKYQKCLVVCYNIDEVKTKFQNHKNLFFVEYLTDDTWARDCSAISIEKDSNLVLLDFTFNAWGEKFSYKKDNAMTANLAKYYLNKTQKIDFILEGGAIESNGSELLLTTSECMLNRNKNLNKEEITLKLKEYFGVRDVLYLEHGYLAGDDTNSHIDTLARFIDEKTIMYVKCNDEKDEHYKELSLMQEELFSYAKKFNLKLIALPMCEKIYFEGERLPATYANFLFVNNAVLVPIYGVKEDKEVLEIFQKTFKNKKIEAINCSTLIKQHGSLHCISKNFHRTTLSL
jgi:agmatine/peptidylarginine deiminase